MIGEDSDRDVGLSDLDIEVNNEEFVVTTVVMGEIISIQVMTGDITITPTIIVVDVTVTARLRSQTKTSHAMSSAK